MTVTQVEGCVETSWRDSGSVAGSVVEALGEVASPEAVSEARLMVILVGVGEESFHVNAPLTRQ